MRVLPRQISPIKCPHIAPRPRIVYPTRCRLKAGYMGRVPCKRLKFGRVGYTKGDALLVLPRLLARRLLPAPMRHPCGSLRSPKSRQRCSMCAPTARRFRGGYRRRSAVSGSRLDTGRRRPHQDGTISTDGTFHALHKAGKMPVFSPVKAAICSSEP